MTLHSPSAGFQMAVDEFWWDSADGSPPAPGTSHPLIRWAGPRDGARMGTVIVAANGSLQLNFGRDEAGRLLPGFFLGDR